MAGETNNAAGGAFGVAQASAQAGGIQKGVIKTVSTNAQSDISTDVGVAPAVDVAPVVEETDLAPPPINAPAIPTKFDQTVGTQFDVNVENPEVSIENSENPENPEFPERSQDDRSYIPPVHTEQVIPSTQSVVVESTTTLAPETTVNNPSGCFVLYLLHLSVICSLTKHFCRRLARNIF